MTDGKNETALTVRTDNTALRNKTAKVSAIQRAEVGAADYVPHVSVGQVKLMAVVPNSGMHKAIIDHLEGLWHHTTCREK